MPREKQYASYKNLAPKDERKDSYQCMTVQDLHHRKKLLTENSIVCLDLWADWCEPCKTVSPQFAELAKQYNNPGRCLLAKENVDLELTRDYQITGIPAFIFYRHGQLLRDQDGTPVSVVGGDINQVRRILDKLIGQNN
jgi:thiol-disulfide isomerase/thioredoxin